MHVFCVSMLLYGNMHCLWYIVLFCDDEVYMYQQVRFMSHCRRSGIMKTNFFAVGVVSLAYRQNFLAQITMPTWIINTTVVNLIQEMTSFGLTHFVFMLYTVYTKKYAHGFCFAVLCCGCTLTDFPISIRLTSLALWQSNDCPSATKATLMNMDKCFMWIHYERLHNHNKAKHNKTVCIFLGMYCI